MKSKSFGLADSCVLLIAAVLLCSLLLTSVVRRRAHARAATCEDQLKQLGLALHNYHSAFKQMPAACGGTSPRDGAELWENNQGRLGPFVGLLPFYEEQRLWEQISNPTRVEERKNPYPAMGPAPWYDSRKYTQWGQRPRLLVCPADRQADQHATVASYTINYGDAVFLVGSPQDLKTKRPDLMLTANAVQATNRGVFVASRVTKFRDILDGLSNTLLFSEARITAPVAKGIEGLRRQPQLASTGRKGATYWPMGRRSQLGGWCAPKFRVPNHSSSQRPAATRLEEDLEGVMPPSSYHAQGVHVIFADGYVRFVTNSIDVGDQNAEPVDWPAGKTPPGAQSPFGLWGAMGTRANREVIDRETPAITSPPREFTALEKETLLKKPVQTWTAASGRGSVKARQIGLENKSLVVLMYENGDIKRVPLSKLSSKDAYRAVQNQLSERIEAMRSLKQQLQRGVELLDKKDFVTFASEMIEGGDAQPEIVAKLIEMERGIFIYRLESAIRSLETNARDFQISEKTEQLSIRAPVPPGSLTSKMKLTYQNGTWQFSLR